MLFQPLSISEYVYIVLYIHNIYRESMKKQYLFYTGFYQGLIVALEK